MDCSLVLPSYAWFVCTGRRLPLPVKLQHTLWACGLRGAVAYGLAVNLPNIDAESDEGIPAIESATLVIVLVSTLLFGGITGKTRLKTPHAPGQTHLAYVLTSVTCLLSKPRCGVCGHILAQKLIMWQFRCLLKRCSSAEICVCIKLLCCVWHVWAQKLQMEVL